MTRNFLLVYGTLRRFHTNNRLMDGARFVDQVRAPGFTLYELGWFPGVKKDPLNNEGVLCDLYEIDDDHIRKLDSYEGYYEDAPENSLFVRERTRVSEYAPFIYVYRGATDMCDKVKSGDWQIVSESAG